MSSTTTDPTIKFLRKRITTLCDEGNTLFNTILCRNFKAMFWYPKEKLNNNWTLDDLYQRTMAAQTLGWDVVLFADEKGLHVRYATQLPTVRPSSF